MEITKKGNCEECGKTFIKKGKKRFCCHKCNTSNWYNKNKEYYSKQRKEYYKNNFKKIQKTYLAYKKNNHDKIIMKQREYNSKPEIKLSQKIYSKNYLKISTNKLRIKIYGREYRIKNKDEERARISKWMSKNREKLNETDRIRWKNDKNFNIKRKLKYRLWFVINKYNSDGKIMNAESYGVNYMAIIEHLKPFPKDLSKYHIDHIRPLCSFDLTDTEQVKEAFAPENHQWLTIKQNLKKGGKWDGS